MLYYLVFFYCIILYKLAILALDKSEIENFFFFFVNLWFFYLLYALFSYYKSNLNIFIINLIYIFKLTISNLVYFLYY